MPSKDRVEMLLLLVQNVDVFAWSPYEVPGVYSKFIIHQLNMDPSYPPPPPRNKSRGGQSKSM